ncbi:MAG TPA: glycosyltransferase [Clostridia bacterium]|nr:glycosyltransferase [Clostridia bacterium]
MHKYNILITTMRLDIGGAETHIVELAKGLAQVGFNVVVASTGGVYEKELISSNIKLYHVPLDNKKPHNVVKAYNQLKSIIEEEKIDLVHAHARIPGFICGLLHKKMRFPFVTTAHGTWKTGYGLRYITNWGQKTVAVSEDIRKYLLDNYKIEDKDIKVTINGIDTDKFSPAVDCSDVMAELKLTAEDTKIVYISRFDSDRSYIINKLLEIIPELAKKIKSLKVIMVGSGNILDIVREKAQEINNSTGNNTVIVAGSRTDINKFTALADLFIGFGRSSLEALASGRPLILAGNVGYIGILDEHSLDAAIKSNFSGRGNNKAESEILRNDIMKVLLQMGVEERKALGAFGRSVIENNYSVKKMVQDNIEVYMQLLEQK